MSKNVPYCKDEKTEIDLDHMLKHLKILVVKHTVNNSYNI